MKKKRKPVQKLLPAPKGSDVGKRAVMRLPKGAHVEIEPTALIMQAVNHGASIDVLERLLNMHERISKENAKRAFDAALAKFQGEVPRIPKNMRADFTTKKGSHVKYDYETLNYLISIIAESLSDNGFSFTWTANQDKESVTANFNLHHIGGHTATTSFTVPIDFDSHMNPAQTVTSALSYAKRTSLKNGLGLTSGEFDDDGKTAGTSPEDKHPEPKGKKEKNDEPIKLFNEAKKLIESAQKVKQLADRGKEIENITKSGVLSDSQIKELRKLYSDVMKERMAKEETK